MKKLDIVLILIFLGFMSELWAQQCLPNGIAFTTQSQIDSFQMNYPGCTHIEGYVTISGNDIVDLTGLSVIKSIGGNLNIYDNENLPGLNGLENLKTVQGDVHIGWNDGPEIGNYLLTSLSGLDSLTYIGDDFEISHSPFLASLTGIEHLGFVGGGLSINNNTSLTNLTALEGLTSIGSSLAIYSNFYLATLDGLNNLTSVGKDLYICYNASLINFSGLENLISIGEDIKIIFNGSLTNLIGLNNITSVGGEIFIRINNELTSLEGLESISANSISSLTIKNNHNLSNCVAQSICDYLALQGGVVDIQNNEVGCNSVAEVEAACETFSIVKIEHASEVLVFPNPASNRVFISSKILKEVNIYDNLGQIVLSTNQFINGIDISSLPKGLYFIEIVSNQLLTREKLIIK